MCIFCLFLNFITYDKVETINVKHMECNSKHVYIRITYFFYKYIYKTQNLHGNRTDCITTFALFRNASLFKHFYVLCHIRAKGAPKFGCNNGHVKLRIFIYGTYTPTTRLFASVLNFSIQNMMARPLSSNG